MRTEDQRSSYYLLLTQSSLQTALFPRWLEACPFHDALSASSFPLLARCFCVYPGFSNNHFPSSHEKCCRCPVTLFYFGQYALNHWWADPCYWRVYENIRPCLLYTSDA